MFSKKYFYIYFRSNVQSFIYLKNKPLFKNFKQYKL